VKREIRTVDESRGIVQFTLPRERWYGRKMQDPDGVTRTHWRPSVTFITSFYPKDPRFLKWLAEHGLEAGPG
jgi:hypothetical protein